MSRCAGVVRAAFLVQTAFIDDSKRTVVVVSGMDTLDVLGQQRNDIAIAADIVVVGALAVLGLATGNQVFNAERAVALGCCAMDYE